MLLNITLRHTLATLLQMEEERQRKHGIVVPEQETDVTSAMLARGRMDKQRVAVDLAEQRKVLAAHMHLVDAQLGRAHTQVKKRRARHKVHHDHHGDEEEPVGPTKSAREHPGTWEARRARDLSLRKRRPVIPKPSRYEAKPRADRTDAEAESRLRTLMAEVDTNLYQLTLPEQVRDAEGWFLKKRSNARQLRSKSIANPLVASQRWLNGPRIAEHKAA